MNLDFLRRTRCSTLQKKLQAGDAVELSNTNWTCAASEVHLQNSLCCVVVQVYKPSNTEGETERIGILISATSGFLQFNLEGERELYFVIFPIFARV